MWLSYVGDDILLTDMASLFRGPKLIALSEWGCSDTVALIYETNVLQKTGRTVISTQSSAFIKVDVNGGYDQIWCHVTDWRMNTADARL